VHQLSIGLSVSKRKKKGTSWKDEAVKRGSNRFQEEQTRFNNSEKKSEMPWARVTAE
jgi:hypothetical protein